jgi:aryl carrier-like protein
MTRTMQTRHFSFSGLRDFVKRKLPDYMLPQRIVTLDRLPRTPNGKIDRQSLLATIATRPALPESRTAGRSDVEKVLLEVWKKVLRLDSVDIDDNFFDLGGNSSLSISVIFEARQAGLEIDLRQFYQHPTIAKLAHTLVEPNRFSLGTKNQDLKKNPDGSLTLYVQPEKPDGDKASNWLSDPDENFSLYIRASRAAAGGADAVDMAVVSAAAAAKHIDVRETPGEIGILPVELERIADVELWRIVELGVAQAR